MIKKQHSKLLGLISKLSSAWIVHHEGRRKRPFFVPTFPTDHQKKEGVRRKLHST
jgi:hypothetical protein